MFRQSEMTRVEIAGNSDRHIIYELPHQSHHPSLSMSQLIISAPLSAPRDDPELTYVNVAIALAFILVDGVPPNTSLEAPS